MTFLKSLDYSVDRSIDGLCKQGKNAGELQKAESQVAFFFFFFFWNNKREACLLACVLVAVDKGNHKLLKTPSFLWRSYDGGGGRDYRDDGGV
jgi:hypothetical protein